MNVMITVTIPLVVILVTVLDLAIDFTVMETLVKVIISYWVYIGWIKKCRLLYYNNNKNMVISDINECAEDIDNCSQLCIDTDGSYTCSCSFGYYLTDNGRGCNGIAFNLCAVYLIL